MPSQIICNVTSQETRVALLENGIIKEVFVERKADHGVVGNIYKGVVNKVLPGMQVAFVDIGLEKAGFLYVSDIDELNHNNTISEYIDPNEQTRLEIVGADLSQKGEAMHEHQPIEELISEGQEIMVQVSKDPMGSKGARITSYISLPGRYLVYMPNIDQVGVSRRIESEEEKKRLKDMITHIKNNGSGYIVRTAAEGKGLGDITSDIKFLDKLWASIKEPYSSAPVPNVIYQDLDLIQRSIRDLFTENVDSVVVDDKQAYSQAISFCNSYLPDIADKISLYSEKEPVFSKFGLEMEIERALGRKVWLRSGGYIIIDQTEALTAIDVNTGKFVGKRDQEETILKTNLEAVHEVVYQLRLRNIGGLIIIDFIDMEREENKEKVYNALEQALKSDRSRTNILKISELGLVEMTRKRSRDSLSRIQTTTCPYCEGRGRIKSHVTILYEVYREIRRVAGTMKNLGELECKVTPGVAELMFEDESDYLDRLEKELGVKVIVKTDFTQHQERFVVAPK